MDVLVTGAGGLLGSNVVAAARSRNLSVSGTFHSERPDFDATLRQLDILDTAVFEDYLDELAPEIVVHCAAMTDVDGCESHVERAREINGRAPGDLSQTCDERGIRFVHVSTDYVFDGESGNHYMVDSEPNPIQVYGRTKLLGEQAVRSAYEAPLIVRPSFIYGVNRSGETPSLSGFPDWVLSQLSDGQPIPLFTDQYVTPSRAGSTADTILDLVAEQAAGTYHVAAQSCVTPYEFGAVIVDQSGYTDDALVASSLSDVDRAAARPPNTCLSVEKTEQVLSRSQPTLQADMRSLVPFF